MSGSGLRVDADLHWEVSQFLYREAALLDAREFEGWLGLLTTDIMYRMPVRVTREARAGRDVDPKATYFEDDFTTLTVRLARFSTRSAWSEDPPSRTRHFISNIMVAAGDSPDELLVESNLLFIRSRGGDHRNDELTGRRCDVLRNVDGVWHLARREVLLDQTVLGTLNLSTIY